MLLSITPLSKYSTVECYTFQSKCGKVSIGVYDNWKYGVGILDLTGEDITPEEAFDNLDSDQCEVSYFEHLDFSTEITYSVLHNELFEGGILEEELPMLHVSDSYDKFSLLGLSFERTDYCGIIQGPYEVCLIDPDTKEVIEILGNKE